MTRQQAEESLVRVLLKRKLVQRYPIFVSDLQRRATWGGPKVSHVIPLVPPTHFELLDKYLCEYNDELDGYDPSYDCTISNAALNRLGLRCKRFKLSCGGSPFLKPISMDTMSSWLEEKQPWTRVGRGPPTKHPGWFLNAAEIGLTLQAYLSFARELFESAVPTAGLIEKTAWKHTEKPNLPDHPELGRYTVIFQLEPKDDLPHLFAFVAARWDLHQNFLNPVELTCLYDLTRARFVDAEPDRHFLPVRIPRLQI